MEEVKLIRNEMKDRVQKLITQKDTSDGKANLAKLRHGIGKMPGEMPELWDVFSIKCRLSFSVNLTSQAWQSGQYIFR